MKGKEYVLQPRSPSQVIADKQASRLRGETSERVNHQKESERHKPKSSAFMMSEKKNLVLFSTKSEMREVCENPSSVMHYVLLCKDEAPKTKTSHDLPLVFSSHLQEFEDVFPDELAPGLPPLRGIEHQIDLIPEHLYLTRLPTTSTLRKLRRSNGKYNNSSTTVKYVKV